MAATHNHGPRMASTGCPACTTPQQQFEIPPCLICGQNLTSAVDDRDNQPMDGLAFKSYGHYGCGVFDPMDGTYLEINVCDECLCAAGEKGRIFNAVEVTGPTKRVVLRKWATE